MLDRESIRQLLLRLGLEPEEVAAEPPAAWHLCVRYPSAESDATVSLLAPSEGQDCLVVRCALAVSEPHREALRALSDQAYRAFRFDLLRDLLMSGRANYRANFDDERRDLDVVVLSRRLWPEALTASDLDSAMQAVFDCLLLCKIRIRATAGDTP